MDAEGLLGTWEAAHHRLSPQQRRAFMARPEIEVLGALPPAAVVAAVAASPKLADIVTEAQSTAWWYRGDDCDPDLLPFCGRCRPYPYPAVVVITTGASDAFHASEHCDWLMKGQREVRARGGSPAAVERVALQVALGAGKLPCLACFPPSRRPGNGPSRV